MKKYFPNLLLLSLVAFSRCREPKAIAYKADPKDYMNCTVKTVDMPSYTMEVIASDIFYIEDSLQIDILPLTGSNDSSDLRVTIQENFRYSEMCKEMQIQGKVYFEISKDSIGNFTETKVLRGMDGLDGTCTISVSKELNRIIKIAPVIEVPAKINSFILAMTIRIRKD